MKIKITLKNKITSKQTFRITSKCLNFKIFGDYLFSHDRGVIQ